MELLLSSVLLNIMESFIVLILFTFLNSNKHFIRDNVIKSILFISLFTLIVTFLDSFIPNGIKPIISIIFLTVLLSFITQVKLFTALITNALIFIFIFTIEIAILLPSTLILSVNIEQITTQYPQKFFVGIIFKIIELILVMFISKSKIKIRILGIPTKQNFLFQLLAMQLLMVIFIIVCLSYISSYRSNIIVYDFFVATIYLLFVALSLVEFKERERLQAIQYNYKAQEDYVKNIESMLDIIRREKHDFSNHMNTLLAISMLKKPDSLQKVENYIKELSPGLINAYHFYNTGNDYVDGMLAVKSNFAYEFGIKFDVDFQVSLKDIGVNDIDITSIIGNIVDNAFTAITSSSADYEVGYNEKECNKKYCNKVISISSYKDSLGYCISISNNGPKIMETEIAKIFNIGFTTKSNKTSEHGYGLYIVNQLLRRNNGTITVQSTDKKTEFFIRFLRSDKT